MRKTFRPTLQRRTRLECNTDHDNRELQAALGVLNDRSRFDELLKRGNTEYDVIAARHKAAAEAAKAKAKK